MIIWTVKHQSYPFANILFVSIQVALVSMVAFGSVYILYLLLIGTSLLTHLAVLWSGAIFKVGFSHPERVVLVIISTFLSTYLVLFLVRIRALQEKYEFR